MPPVLKSLVAAGIFSILAGTASIKAAPQGFVEGHLKIVSLRAVEVANGGISKGATGNLFRIFVDHLEPGGTKRIAGVTADRHGNYRLSLSLGDYILEVQGRAREHVRAKPQPFTVTSNQTFRVDTDIDTGIR